MQRIFENERRGVRPKAPVPPGLLWAGPPRRCGPRPMHHIALRPAPSGRTQPTATAWLNMIGNCSSSDVMTDPEGMPAAWLEPLFNVCEIDVVHAIAVESPEDPQGVGPRVLEGVHHATWHKNGISRTNRQGLVANVSHSRAR